METRKNTVVLTALNAKYIHSSLSVWYLAAGIKQNAPQLNTAVIEATIHENCESIKQNILAHGFFAVCFSCYIWNIEKTLELAFSVKKACPTAHIILGGPEAEFNASALLHENGFISYISLGEGEESLPKLLSALKKGETPQNISGTAFLNGDEIIINKAAPLNAPPPSPYCDEYLAQLKSKLAYIESSRGCPYSCAFCLSGAGCAPKWFSLKRTENDILTLCKTGAKTIKFIDRTFNANRKHANEIWRFVAENYGKAIPLGTRFHFEIAADILTPECIEILNKMPRGAVQLEAGIQSINEKTLMAVRRKTDTERLLQNLNALIGAQNLHVHIDLIAGLPHEDLQSFINGFNRVYYLKANMLQLGFLKLLHGSAMRNEPQNYPCEYRKTPPYEIIKTPWLSEKDITLLQEVEDALERLYNSARFLFTLDYALNASRLTPFELFAAVGRVPSGTALPDYVAHAFNRLAALPGIEKQALRDNLAADWLSFNSTGRLPPALSIADNRLKAAVKALAHSEMHAPRPQTKRGTALLYSQSAVIYADYTNPDEITGRYKLTQVPFGEIFGE